MADTKGSALTDGDPLASGEYLVGVSDPGGTPATVRFTRAVVATGIEAELVGLRSIWIPAASMRTRETSGATAATSELAAAADVNIETFDFSSAADQFVQFTWVPPTNWDAGTITAKFYWSTDGSQTAGEDGVQWYIQGYAYADSDDIDVAAFGTAVTYGSPTQDDHSGTTDELAITAATGNCTIGGTPTAGDMVIFQVYDDVSAGDLTSTTDARLHGVVINYTIDSFTVT